MDSDSNHSVKYEPVKYEPVKYEPVKHEPVKHEPVKHEPIKYESVKAEALGFKSELNAQNAYQDNKLKELIASLKQKNHTKSGRSNVPKQEVEHDPNQLQTEFNEDAETAVPVETYITYEPKKCNFSHLIIYY